ncbi:hypothetical protein EJ08DRAFT_651934 [Tothia fuscella]|uniref:Uncharacterized protein n=1 Tax=Tothia fuscella TaxID=1048955 RepID=A0A9P4NLA2_9PEZI|nr:hypothetical protein EJ08DRAFT_651934 [Tothia fuscella]
MASSSDNTRRHHNAALPIAATSSSNAIPPAPPLPPPRSQPARSAFARFVQPFSGYGSSRPASAQTTNRDSGGKTAAGYAAPPRISGFNTHYSEQKAEFKTKGASEIAAIDVNHERTHAILAGREILETIKVSGTVCGENHNIRATIINKDRNDATRHRDNLDIRDVKWSHGQYDTTIATAASNGKVVIYDLNREDIEVARLHEHQRQVHRIAFNPHHGPLLLSGSQDTTVRLWDLRDMRSDVMSCSSRRQYMGQSQGVRDIRWSPTDGFEFASGTDGGVVFVWDSRNAKSSKIKINAHQKECTAVDWHPDGKHLLSAGKDNNLMVWDISSGERRRKAKWTLRTPYPIANARWRPPCLSSDDQGQETWQCTQVITSYERVYSDVQLWDLRRPHMPFREMYPFTPTAPTDMLWHSADLLWCASRAGQFKQVDVKYTNKTIDRRPLTAFAFSHTGEMMIFSQKRVRSKKPAFDAPPIISSTRRGSQPMLPGADLARNSTDDSIGDSFLSTSHPKHHRRTLSDRSIKSVSGTPPSLQAGNVAKLDETLNNNKHTFQPKQLAARGLMPGHPNQQHFAYLAQKYKLTALPENPTVDDYLNVSKVFEQNAMYAEKTSNSRVAQTWRMFGSTLQKELIQRADHNKRRRLGLVESELDPLLVLPEVLELSEERDERDHLSAQGGKPQKPASLAVEALGVDESTSNVPTPIARPMHSSSSEWKDRRIPNLDQGEQLSLPPGAMSRSGGEGFFSEVDPAAAEKAEGMRPGYERPEWYSSVNDLSERKAMMSNYRARQKMPLELERPQEQTSNAINIPPPLDRHNSDESFAMFPASSESKGIPSIPASYTSQRSRKQSMGSIPEHRLPHFHVDLADSGDRTIATPAVTESSQSSSSKEKDLFSAEYDNMYPPKDQSRARGAASLQRDREGKTHDVHSSAPSEQGEPTGSRGTISPCEHKEPTGFPGKLAAGISGRLGAENANSAKKLHRPIHSKSDGSANVDEPTITNPDDVEFLLEDFTDTRWLIQGITYPVSVGKMIEELFMYTTGPLADVQHIFHLVAILRPFLPGSIVMTQRVYATIGKQRLEETKHELEKYADFCLNTVNLTPDDTAQLLANPLMHLVRFGIPPRQAELMFKMYETKLHASKLFVPLVMLRRIAAESFATYKETQLANSQIGETCMNCKKPIPKNTGKCDNCGKGHDECPICWQRFSPYHVTKRARQGKNARLADTVMAINGYGEPNESAPATKAPKAPPLLWQTCLSCGHGCHSACMIVLQDDAKTAGRCPAIGCDCACFPGPYRDQMIREREAEAAEKNAGSVHSDNHRISESSAVKGARGILDEGKKVRVVEPAHK